MVEIIIVFAVTRILYWIIHMGTEQQKNKLELIKSSISPDKRRKKELNIYRGEMLAKIVDFGGCIYVLLIVIEMIIGLFN